MHVTDLIEKLAENTGEWIGSNLISSSRNLHKYHKHNLILFFWRVLYQIKTLYMEKNDQWKSRWFAFTNIPLCSHFSHSLVWFLFPRRYIKRFSTIALAAVKKGKKMVLSSFLMTCKFQYIPSYCTWVHQRLCQTRPGSRSHICDELTLKNTLQFRANFSSDFCP